ncbi:DUF6291 domain-containing protein [Chryseobacterium sp. SN22]|uniref:DUF6291 domain-containing protein n=1 Tax=Chryseobacterium sp. SN22 TaxID=2606431 RepID=UPI001E5628A7|nr:DUF6291 domain-containing protein [Chryseobacterium sp. SN22]
MAKDKKSFVAYSDWNSTFEKLSDEEAGKLAKMMFSFVSDLNPEAPDRITELLFEPIKNQLERDLEKYKEVRQKRSEAGRNGGVKSGESRSKSDQNEANESNMKQNEAIASFLKQNEAVNVNVIVNDILLEKETKEEKLIKENSEELFSDSEPVKPDAEKRKKVAPKKEKAQPPDLDAFVEFGKEIYQNELKLDFSLYEFAVRAKYQSWIDAGWKDGHKKPIENWKNKLRTLIPYFKPIYGKSNNNNSGNGFGNRTGNTSMGQGGKKSTAAILAERARNQAAGNGYSGNFTGET